VTRREFILILGVAMTAGLAPRAQQRTTVVIGFFAASGPNVVGTTAFRQGLSETGYIGG
jgi:hypothetical protein